MRDSHTSLDEVIKVLTDNPHISELHLFGSRAIEKSDELSDIDLTATSPHPAAAEAYARKSLADKFGLSAVYTIKNDEHEIARTFCLSGMSPFHKIDIGFSLPSEVKFFPNSRLILKNNKPQKPSIEFKKMDRTTRRARLFRRDDGLVALHQTPPSRRKLAGVQMLPWLY